MTSRFGKTYSRKGGEGTSKFDEVLSTKRGTLSTKWGDTTYKAKVGSKRAGAPKNDSVLEVYKRPRPSGDGMEDPFGFDSDEESKPVSSRSKSSPAKSGAAEPPQAERPGAGLSLNMGSMSSLQGGGTHSLTASRGASSWMNNDRSQPPRIVEDTARFFNSSTATTGNTQTDL
ncbi:wings apart-like protein homolog [Notothenia coriiceps]|uniref:Wings apart-like protein homolog n=1 Tax=Notothenia coriiceps TaxID=8208 RepID=A0A6I9MMC5_9TELE|nr:PREDICTED: wings apart-like protein homolog [Notothenia coriiceps]